MTRKRLNRLRRKYNASRRVLRGWQAIRWNQQIEIANDEYASADEHDYAWRAFARYFKV